MSYYSGYMALHGECHPLQVSLTATSTTCARSSCNMQVFCKAAGMLDFLPEAVAIACGRALSGLSDIVLVDVNLLWQGHQDVSTDIINELVYVGNALREGPIDVGNGVSFSLTKSGEDSLVKKLSEKELTFYIRTQGRTQYLRLVRSSRQIIAPTIAAVTVTQLQQLMLAILQSVTYLIQIVQQRRAMLDTPAGSPQTSTGVDIWPSCEVLTGPNINQSLCGESEGMHQSNDCDLGQLPDPGDGLIDLYDIIEQQATGDSEDEDFAFARECSAQEISPLDMGDDFFDAEGHYLSCY